MSASSAGSGPLTCGVSCEEGQYCIGENCLPCPPGQFQKRPIHTETSCNYWTRKPPGEHWEIKRNGTSYADIEWQCEKGFVEIECGVECQECVVATKPATTSTTSIVSFSIIQQNTTNKNIIVGPEKHGEQEGLSGGEIAAICVPLVVIIAAVVVYCLWKKQIVCSKKNKPASPVLNGGQANIPLTDPEAVDSPEPEKDNLFPFFYRVVEQLGPDNALKLLYHLPGVDHDWVTRTVGWQKKKNDNPKIYYPDTFIEWMEKDLSLDHEKEVISACEKLGLDPNSSDQLGQKNFGPLSYYLYDNLGPEDATAFLGRFGATQSFTHKQEAGKSVQKAFVETLCEILKNGRATASSLSDTLKEIKHNDIVESDEYKEFCMSVFVGVDEGRDESEQYD